MTPVEYRIVRKILRNIDPRCRYCRRVQKSSRLSLDHIVPLCRGGLDVPENVTLACEFCNFCKSERMLDEWIRDLAAVRTVGVVR